MSVVEQFGQRPFVAGTLTGLRAFLVTPSGGLTGVMHRDLWTPAVNIAQCHAPRMMFPPQLIAAVSKSQKAPEPYVHTYVGLDCTCGFYAYFDGSNDYLHQRAWHLGAHVAGIVEGWGKCVVGTRGFRCEKVRLRALILPAGHGEPDLATLLERVRDSYPSVPWFESQPAALAEFPLTGVAA